MKHITRQHFSKSMAAAFAVCLLGSGCSTQPYVRSAGMNNSLGYSPKDAPQARLFAGDLEQAIRDVDAQRMAYFERLEERTKQRNLLSGTLIGLSAAALYQGIASSNGASGRAVTNLGAVAGGTYALANYSNNPNAELAYLNAANDLTCLILRTRPWLLKADEFETFKKELGELASATARLDTLFQQQAAKSGNSPKYVANHHFEKQMLYNARVTLRKASNFKGFVETAGFQLRQEAVLAINAANLEIHRLQPDLVNPSAALAGLRSTSQAFRDIKPLDVPSAATQSDASDQPDAPQSAAQVMPTASGKTNTPTASATPAASTETNEKSASSDLGKAADTLTDLLKMQSDLLTTHKKATESAHKKTQRDIGQIERQLSDIAKAIEAGQAAKVNLTVNPLTTADAEKLATNLSAVLDAMRKVNAALTRAYSLKPYVKNIAQCQRGDAPVFAFTFDQDEVTLSPGQSFEVAVKGGVGVPHIWLSGTKGDAKGEMPKFTTSIDGGIARAKLTLLSTTPAGELHIMAADGSGKQHDDIKVMVVPEKK